MDLATFSQLGIGIATLFILWLVVKYFIEFTNKKEDSNNKNVMAFNRTIMKFNKTINNHIDHQTKSNDKMSEALIELTKAIHNMQKKT